MQCRWQQKIRLWDLVLIAFFVQVLHGYARLPLVVFSGSVTRFYRANSGFNGVGGI